MPRLERTLIGIFGRINAGKSTCMNLLTQQETSLVDIQPGTTADIKSALMEIHALGPIKLLDTAGLDEDSDLGRKKQRQTLNALAEVDLAVLVIDPVQVLLAGELTVEDLVAVEARRRSRRLCVVLNRRADSQDRLQGSGADWQQASRFALSFLLDPADTPVVALDLADPDQSGELVSFLAAVVSRRAEAPPLLPMIKRRGAVVLQIPLDAESPSERLLRPQEMAMAALLRAAVPVGLYRVDLDLARSRNLAVAERQRRGFVDFLAAFRQCGGVQLVLTDSQAIDLMVAWVPDETPLTTFSIMMVNQTAGGDLAPLVAGTRVLDSLRAGDRVLIAEACNHDRIAEDIGTVQLPRRLAAAIPGLEFDHAFGRAFPDQAALCRYKLAIHCGACMISPQQLAARSQRLREAGVPMTNYGLALSWCEGRAALDRVLAPWLA